MKIGVISDGAITDSKPEEKLHEMLREAIRADELGFYYWGTSETHFIEGPSISQPDALYGAIASHTERIKIRYMAITIPFHNPLTIAERLATIDIMSKGRAQLCTARGNNKQVMQAFGVKPAETRDRWKESMKVIGSALTDGKASNTEGQYWPFEEVPVFPAALQRPSPPLFSVSSGPDSHRLAAEYGVGVINFDNFFGWDFIDECIAAYRGSIGQAIPVNGVVNDNYGYYIPICYCDTDREAALSAVADRAFGYVDFLLHIYGPLAAEPSYEYFEGVNRLKEYRRDLPHLLNIGPSVLAGTPDDFITALEVLQSRGVDEVTLSIDGMSHERNMKTLELIGKHVLPHFDNS